VEPTSTAKKIEIEYFVETLSKILIMSQSKIPTFLNYPNTVTTLEKDKIPTGIWSMCIICVNCSKDFEVNILLDNHKIYLKPIKPYFMKEFELLFDFGIACENYDESRVVLVKK